PELDERAHAERLRVRRIQTKNGAPQNAVMTPTESSAGATTLRASVSAASRNAPPASADVGTSAGTTPPRKPPSSAGTTRPAEPVEVDDRDDHGDRSRDEDAHDDAGEQQRLRRELARRRLDEVHGGRGEQRAGERERGHTERGHEARPQAHDLREHDAEGGAA